MRELEDARSLAGLAMDVYSDRISIDQEDQERLRFSADDITRLETHHAINLWVAHGTPRPGFVAQTLPWEDLHDHASPTTTAKPNASAAATAPPTSPIRSPPMQPKPGSRSEANGAAKEGPTKPARRRAKRPPGKPVTGTQLVWDDLEELD